MVTRTISFKSEEAQEPEAKEAVAKEVAHHVERGTWDLLRGGQSGCGTTRVCEVAGACSISGEQHMAGIRPVSLRDLRRGLELSGLVDGSADGDGGWYAAADESFRQG